MDRYLATALRSSYFTGFIISSIKNIAIHCMFQRSESNTIRVIMGNGPHNPEQGCRGEYAFMQSVTVYPRLIPSSEIMSTRYFYSPINLLLWFRAQFSYLEIV